jgi:hypothetical protein
MLATVSRALSLIGLVTAPLAAEVVRIEVRADVNERPSAPPVPVDPTLPAHTILTDIDEAPWDANGKSNSRPICFGHVNTVHCEWRPNLEV